MAPKHIVSLGFNFPAADILDIEELATTANTSLFDADIIVLDPHVLNSNGIKKISHWQEELSLALRDGKSIFIFLSQVKDPNYNINTYNLLSVRISGLVSKRGNQIKVARDLGSLATYWRNFSEYSNYEVYFDFDRETTLLKTKTGNKAVGAIIPAKNGNLILLPNLEFSERLQEFDERKIEHYWTEKAISHGKKLKASFIEIDKALRSGQANTPPPEWSQQPVYKLKSELELETSIAETNSKIDELQQKLELDQAELEKQGQLKWLLYETGKPLEAAILEALKIIGFSAENYEDDESEFDAVFVSEEGRFIGEAEGKDNKAINVAKCDQLERELREDFARDEITEYAKGVLFGNAYRLKELEQREDFFTKKCLSGAKRTKIALIRTPDLFPIAKYLKENNDPNFAQLCRQAIANTEGEIVKFPNINLCIKNYNQFINRLSE